MAEDLRIEQVARGLAHDAGVLDWRSFLPAARQWIAEFDRAAAESRSADQPMGEPPAGLVI